jgi:hypothetical protein
MNLYVHHAGRQLGPFTEDDLRRRLAAGEFTPADLVWWDGQASWIPLGQSAYGSVGTPAGAPLAPAPGVGVPVAETSGLAVASLVCGVGGLACAVTAVPAIITGHMARGQIKRNPALRGAGMALAGLILGYLVIALFLVIFTISFLIALGKQVKLVNANIASQLQSEESATNSAPDNTH